MICFYAILNFSFSLFSRLWLSLFLSFYICTSSLKHSQREIHINNPVKNIIWLLILFIFDIFYDWLNKITLVVEINSWKTWNISESDHWKSLPVFERFLINSYINFFIMLKNLFYFIICLIFLKIHELF